MHSAHTAYSRSHSSPYSPIPSAHSRIALGEGRGCAGAKRSDERVRTHVRSVRSDRRSGEQVELGKLRKRATGCYTYSLARLPTLSAARRPLPSGMGAWPLLPVLLDSASSMHYALGDAIRSTGV